ncbi:hypothetical protein ACHAW5_008214 [Stephanodiscus triporus]|uniref:GAF domain-containing protein n=1 Tax=Stephanodiscus triporus TaxID=2934178 RepID=A0ABD3NCB3_9STRA
MEVLGSKEGDVYELDPFNNMEDDDIGYYPLHHHKRRHSADSVSSAGSSIMTTNFDNQIRAVTSFSFAKSKQPSVIILDEILIGSTAFEVCEEIRNMGAWGEYVNLFIIAAPKSDVIDNEDESSVSTKANVQFILDRLNCPSFACLYVGDVPHWPPVSHSVSSLCRTRDCWTAFRKKGLTVSLVSVLPCSTPKSNVGLPDVPETPRDNAFCAHTILQDDIMVVPDAMQDERFADNPLVDGAPNIRFYAGCPIRVSSNNGEEKFPIGTLCIVDYKPRDLCEEEVRALERFWGNG